MNFQFDIYKIPGYLGGLKRKNGKEQDFVQNYPPPPRPMFLLFFTISFPSMQSKPDKNKYMLKSYQNLKADLLQRAFQKMLH